MTVSNGLNRPSSATDRNSYETNGKKLLLEFIRILKPGIAEHLVQGGMMHDTSSNDLSLVVAQAIEEIKSEQGLEFSKEKINLAELERRIGISRGKLRRLKANGFKDTPHGLSGRRNRPSVLMGYESVLDGYFRKGIRNSSVCLDALREMGYTGGQTTVRDCLCAHLDPMPAKRQAVEPQGNRGRRY